MLGLIVVGVLSLAAGFGMGRVNLKAKLAAVEAEINNVEKYADAEVRKVLDDFIARIKKVL